MSSIKQKIFAIYYQGQVGYSIFAWFLGLTSFTGVIFLVLKAIYPGTPFGLVSIGIPIIGFFFLSFVGYLGLRYDFFRESQAFGGKKNPGRLNWEMEYIKAKMDTEIGRALVAFHKGEKYNTEKLEASIKEFDDFKHYMEELLK